MNDNIYILQTEEARYRPVMIEDAEFIVVLRNQKHAKGMIHDTSMDVECQRQWIRDYLNRKNEYYWIIETLSGTPIGTIGFYNYDEEKNQIESGRWVMMRGHSLDSFSGEILLKDFAFNILKVERVVCDVVIENKKVIVLHKFLGERELRREMREDKLSDSVIEVVCFEVTKEMWKSNRIKLQRYSGKESDRTVYNIKENRIEIMNC